MDKEVVKELIQDELSTQNIKIELAKILEGPHRETQLKNYEDLAKKLGGPGASSKTATLIIENL